jgi:uncharacterized membrane protein
MESNKEMTNEEIISELKLEIKDLKKQITYDDITKANETIKTTDIKGKDYAEVNQRIKAFRMVYPNGTIKPTMISNENGVCIFKVEIYSERYTLLAVGHAYEKEGSTFINKTSYIENCETSAVGRALGMCGFGIDTSVASAEEVENAIANQNEKQPTKKPIKSTLATENQIKIIKEKLNEEQIGQALALVKREKLEYLTIQEASSLIKKIGGEK